MTSGVKKCALRARSTHGVHHAIVEVNTVIGVVLGEVLVARVPLVVDAVIGLTLGLIAHVVIVVFVVAIFKIIFLYGRYTLYRNAKLQQSTRGNDNTDCHSSASDGCSFRIRIQRVWRLIKLMTKILYGPMYNRSMNLRLSRTRCA